MKRSSTWSTVDEKAQATLNYVLDEGVAEPASTTENVPQVPVSEALADASMISFASGRTQARILFLTSDPKALEQDSWLRQHVTTVADQFAEVHVGVLVGPHVATSGATRIAPTVWTYSIGIRGAFFFKRHLLAFAKDQLTFTGGFRPDVIVALDPYEAGRAAFILARAFERPFQVHVREDFTVPQAGQSKKDYRQKYALAASVLRRSESVRAASVTIQDALAKKFPQIEDLGVLPRHFEVRSLLQSPRGSVLRSTYPQYAFFILAAGPFTTDSAMFHIVDAARGLLRSPTIALVMLGDGPQRALLQERAKLLGVERQVIFEKDNSRFAAYALSADVFVSVDTTPESDAVVIQAAAAGLPLVVVRTPLREDLFTNEMSALLVPPDNPLLLQQALTDFLNKNALRIQLGMAARDVIKYRLHDDPNVYKRAYRDSIEVVFGKFQGHTKEE